MMTQRKGISYTAAAEAEEIENQQVEINTNFGLIDGMLHDYQTDHKTEDTRSIAKATFACPSFTSQWIGMELCLVLYVSI